MLNLLTLDLLRAFERKTIKYESLVKRARENGYSAKFISLEVGSRGIVNLPSFHFLKDLLKISSCDYKNLLIKVASAAIKGSSSLEQRTQVKAR